MKFDLELPECQFPRLTITVKDENLFGDDLGVGQAVISLRKLLKKLNEDG